MKTIRALRQERGWTQFELAVMVGVQPQAVYFWESGRRTPQVPQLRKLGEIFGMCSDDINLLPIHTLTEDAGDSGGDRAEAIASGQDSHGRATALQKKRPRVGHH